MHSAGHNAQLQQNRKMYRRNKKAFQKQLVELNQSAAGGHSYFTPEQIKEDKTTLESKIKRQSTYKTISVIIVLSLITLFVLVYFLS